MKRLNMKRLTAEVDYGQLVKEYGDGTRLYKRTVTKDDRTDVAELINTYGGVVDAFLRAHGEFARGDVDLNVDEALITVYVDSLSATLGDDYPNQPGKLFFRVNVSCVEVSWVKPDGSVRTDIEANADMFTFTYAGEKC